MKSCIFPYKTLSSFTKFLKKAVMLSFWEGYTGNSKKHSPKGTPESYPSNQSVNLEKNNPEVFYKKDFKNLQNF